MDRLLFGDNQFFGVNHMSEEKARAQAMRFQDLDAVMAVLDAAYDEGIHTFMCTTHERVAEIVEVVRSQPERYAGFTFYPCMPYAHKYANAVTDYGMLGALRRFLPDDGLVATAFKGGRAVARKDVESMITMLIDAEMSMFRGVPTPVVFLQNVVVDLLLGLGFDEAFAVFAHHVRDKYGAEPGYITMNLVPLLDVLDRVGIENPIVCSNMNKLEFRMSGGADGYRAVLEERQFRAIAMSVFASGALSPQEAFGWVAEFPAIESVVFGASTAAHIHSTREIADQVWPRAAVPGRS
ncbi:hypothetical protein [Nocardioides mangrovi]|uniref:Uncharacterized protein n=1 Tax=Nocardioides mangrovi TaxID=2874580 RepID=A0ABS7UGI7_9ACTN|nr:hypothetical protein [Nocardioides mangrovi]MBZ5739738.1 hypothetical protein [Nocardioides mangrovi]